ncbi:MAG: ABC transporter permease subunit [Thermoanaerobaculia bacterium]|nr:ABC transporter permease subunit [Thermoanaerobaculia bacterium]
MNGILANLLRELRAYFFSPLAYVVMTLMLLVNGYVFVLIVSFLNDPRVQVGAPLELFFGQTIFFWAVVLLFAPALTMRLVSEERRSGTIEVLMTAPVSEAQVVVGKYLAAFCFYLFLWSPTFLYAGILDYYGDVAWGPVLSGFLGVMGVGALFLAVGTFASVLTRNQLVAAILAFVLLTLLFSVGLLESLASGEAARETLDYLNLWRHMDDFGKGIVDTRHLVYYLSGAVFFLFLATRALAVNKWR